METQRQFLRLFLKTTPSQQIALASTVTNLQLKALVEIAYNLPILTDLGKHHKFLTYLGNPKHSLKYKRTLLKKNAARFVRAICPVKEKLLELLK